MKKEKILPVEMDISSDNYVSDIYNYCDRWCNHCSLAGECPAYSETLENEITPGDDLTGMLANEMLAAMETNSTGQNYSMLDAVFPDLPCEILDISIALFEFVRKFEQEGNENEGIHLAFETIEFQAIVMAVKFDQSLKMKQDDKKQNAYRNGAAKTGLVSIEKNLNALELLFEKLPEIQDSILNLMNSLSEVKILAEELFSEAKSFIRPVFDE